jgi:hypothetical protein
MENSIEIYQSADDQTQIEVRFESESVWLTQAQMSALFERDQSVISRHIKKVFADGELEEKSNMHFLHTANSDKPVSLYSLDLIISVGYRINSIRGTQFRQWATQRLRDYLIKGYALNAQRLRENLTDLQQAIHRKQSANYILR